MSLCKRCGRWNGAIAGPLRIDHCVCGFAQEQKLKEQLQHLKTQNELLKIAVDKLLSMYASGPNDDDWDHPAVKFAREVSKLIEVDTHEI